MTPCRSNTVTKFSTSDAFPVCIVASMIDAQARVLELQQVTQHLKSTHITEQDTEPLPNSVLLHWNVTDNSLAPLPLYYPLERTHSLIPLTTASPGLIAARISDLCTRRNIVARYNHKNCVAHLTLKGYCEFNVSLFSTGGDTPGTIVEVQRRSGCSLAFHRCAWKILAVAEGEEDMDSDNFFPVSVTIEKAEDLTKENCRVEHVNALTAMEIEKQLLYRMSAN